MNRCVLGWLAGVAVALSSCTATATPAAPAAPTSAAAPAAVATVPVESPPAEPRRPPLVSSSGRPVAVTVQQLPAAAAGSAAYAGVVYRFAIDTDSSPERLTVSATDLQGHTRSGVVRTGPIVEFYYSLTVGQGGIYAWTDVIHKFSDLPDEVLRIDPATLRVVSRREIPQPMGLSALGGALFGTTATSIRRLDPVTLATLAHTDRTSPLNPPMGGVGYWALTLGAGKLWAIYGDAFDADVATFDPQTLHRLPGAWRVPPGQGLHLVGTPAGVWLVGIGGANRALANGTLSPTVVLPETIEGSVAAGDDVLATGDATAPLLLVHVDGTTEHLAYANADCRQLVSDGSYAWLQCGDPGTDLVRLALPGARAG